MTLELPVCIATTLTYYMVYAKEKNLLKSFFSSARICTWFRYFFYTLSNVFKLNHKTIAELKYIIYEISIFDHIKVA